jgi:cytochrome bd ubiquinol oxidase subunit II
VTVREAASSPQALKVVFAASCLSVPAIAGPTIHSYRALRGRTAELKYA